MNLSGLGVYSPMVKLTEQANVVTKIPGGVLMYWPAWFTFSFVEYVEGMLISVVPPVSGIAGTVVNAGLRGMTRVVQMVTWDAVKAGGASA